MKHVSAPAEVLRMRQVCQQLGVSRSQAYNLRKEDPTFPRAIRLGKSAVGYLSSEIAAWLQSRERV